MMRGDEFPKKVIARLPFTPNQDQVAAIGKISEFMLSAEDRSVFVLRGYAGTGKTNLVSAFTKVLPEIKWRSVLMAPTGRAAKVLSAYSQREAQTIHKKIFKKETGPDGRTHFLPAENLHRNTVFIVDEASMISGDNGGEQLFNSILENLFEYVYSGDNCKLMLIGDNAQLPPVGSNESPAIDFHYLKAAFHLTIYGCELKEVARQRLESGILLNATMLREKIISDPKTIPRLQTTSDLIRLQGDELEDVLNDNIREYGEENVIIITRSNKRANLFNQSYRNRIKLFEDDLNTGDRLMVVKNNYFWLPENQGEASFIANGDMVEIMRIIRREELYGFHFAECQVRFVDYPHLPEIQVKMLTDGLYTDFPALSPEEQTRFYETVLEDVSDLPSRGQKMNYLRKNPYFNALQVKFSYAITCHKSQGGQWPAVFIDQGYLKDENLDEGFLRWLYTALTRATERVYLLNFNAQFFG